jgi:hypothetical protein
MRQFLVICGVTAIILGAHAHEGGAQLADGVPQALE